MLKFEKAPCIHGYNLISENRGDLNSPLDETNMYIGNKFVIDAYIRGRGPKAQLPYGYENSLF